MMSSASRSLERLPISQPYGTWYLRPMRRQVYVYA